MRFTARLKATAHNFYDLVQHMHASGTTTNRTHPHQKKKITPRSAKALRVSGTSGILNQTAARHCKSSHRNPVQHRSTTQRVCDSLPHRTFGQSGDVPAKKKKKGLLFKDLMVNTSLVRVFSMIMRILIASPVNLHSHEKKVNKMVTRGSKTLMETEQMMKKRDG